MRCDCVAKVNKSLREHNEELETRLQVNFVTGESKEWPLLATRKINSKIRKPKREIIPAYCPVCGKKTRVARKK